MTSKFIHFVPVSPIDFSSGSGCLIKCNTEFRIAAWLGADGSKDLMKDYFFTSDSDPNILLAGGVAGLSACPPLVATEGYFAVADFVAGILLIVTASTIPPLLTIVQD